MKILLFTAIVLAIFSESMYTLSKYISKQIPNRFFNPSEQVQLQCYEGKSTGVGDARVFNTTGKKCEGVTVTKCLKIEKGELY